MVSDEEGEDKMATVGPIARGALELRKKGKDPMYILYLFIYLFCNHPLWQQWTAVCAAAHHYGRH
jgi:hypothetical protein